MSKIVELLSKYRNFIYAIELFDESWVESLGLDGNRKSLDRLLESGKINRTELVKEFNEVYYLKKFDWIYLSRELNIINPNDLIKYSSNEIKALVCYYLYPYISSHFTMYNTFRIEQQILSNYDFIKHDNDWVSVDALVNCIKKEFEWFELYMIHDFLERTSLKFEIQRKNEGKWFSIHKIRVDKSS
jgi:hypothetical protein